MQAILFYIVLIFTQKKSRRQPTVRTTLSLYQKYNITHFSLCQACFYVCCGQTPPVPRHLLSRNHPLRQQNARHNPCQCGQQCTCQSKSCFGYFCCHKVNRHRVEHGFRTAHHDGSYQTDIVICPIALEQIQHYPRSRRGGKHFND